MNIEYNNTNTQAHCASRCASSLFPTSAALRFAPAGTARRNVFQQPARMFTASRLLAEAQTKTQTQTRTPTRVRKSYKQEMQEKGAVDLEADGPLEGRLGGLGLGFRRSDWLHGPATPDRS